MKYYVLISKAIKVIQFSTLAIATVFVTSAYAINPFEASYQWVKKLVCEKVIPSISLSSAAASARVIQNKIDNEEALSFAEQLEFITQEVERVWSEANIETLMGLAVPFDYGRTEPRVLQDRMEIARLNWIAQILKQRGQTFSSISRVGLGEKNIQALDALFQDESIRFISSSSASTSGAGIYSPGESDFEYLDGLYGIDSINLRSLFANNDILVGQYTGGRYAVYSNHAVLAATSNEIYEIEKSKKLRDHAATVLREQGVGESQLDWFVRHIQDFSGDDFSGLNIVRDSYNESDDYMYKHNYLQAMIALALWRLDNYRMSQGYVYFPTSRGRKLPFVYLKATHNESEYEIIIKGQIEQQLNEIREAIQTQYKIAFEELEVIEEVTSNYNNTVRATIKLN